MHCNLKPPDVAPVVLGCFWGKCVLHMHINCYFPASNQNSDIITRFSNPDILKKSNELASRRRFHAVTLNSERLTLNICSTLYHVKTLCQIWAKSNNLRLSDDFSKFFARFSRGRCCRHRIQGVTLIKSGTKVGQSFAFPMRFSDFSLFALFWNCGTLSQRPNLSQISKYLTSV